MDTHCMVCVEHATPKLFQTSAASISKLGLAFNPQGGSVRTSGEFLNKIPDLGFSVMADSLAHTAIIFQSMNLCRHQIALNSKNIFLIFKDVQHIRRELQKIFTYHTNLFRLLLWQKDVSEGDRELIQLCKLHLDIQFHTLSHDVFTLFLKATYSPFNFNRSPEINLQFEYTQALNAASRVVKLDQLLRENPYHMYRVQFLANAIVFLIHNHQKHPEPDKVLKMLSLGCNMMDRLKTHPTYRLMATLAQTLINKHLQLHKITLITPKATNATAPDFFYQMIR
ncbi:hypothetical protein DSO57_1002398 [Entomophthora muscae]|uniref:Uncharacterized protein n=1 Tax=Entomophthora muscae TaxID=34485 RepID=A0ACC2RNQ0_9FUNG|nr:hypothetical protein DSO57_1002398 [Entomophthora muscae]